MVIEKTQIKVLVFDVYGTLLNPLSIETKASQITPDGLAFMALWRAKQLEYSWLLSLMGRYESFWQITERALTYTCQRLNVALSPEQQRQLLDAWTAVAAFEGVTTGLETLRSKGVRLGVLSNGNPAMLEAGLSNAGIWDKLEAVLSVEKAGVFKPAPQVYGLVLPEFGLADPAQIGFVSSNSWDAIGATAFGFEVFWLNRTGGPLDELGLIPAHQVSSFDQIVEIVTSQF